jgi:hypothetical protein
MERPIDPSCHYHQANLHLYHRILQGLIPVYTMTDYHI